MYVRLAFAVAAHLESEIIIVDEVLAVGDAEFQKKCLGKMGQVSKSEGRTVLFVSHNMAAISSLCTRVIVLKDGQISFTGEVESGIDHYLDNPDIVRGFAILHDKKSKWWKQPRAFSKLLSVETLNNKEESQRYFMMGSCMKIKISFEITDDREDVEVGIFFLDHRENTIGLLSSAAEGFIDFRKGINVYQIDIPEIKLMPGEYVLGIWIVHQREVDDAFEHALSIEILADNFTGNYVDYNRFKGYGSIIRSNWYNITQE